MFLGFLLLFTLQQLPPTAVAQASSPEAEKLFLTGRIGSSFLMGSHSIIKVYSSKNKWIGTLRSSTDTRRSRIEYNFGTFFGLPLSANDEYLAAARSEALKENMAIFERFGFPRIIHVTVVADSVYALVFLSEKPEPYETLWSVGPNFFGVLQTNFPFHRAVLLNLNREPETLRVYDLPQHIEGLGGYDTATDLQLFLGVYAYADIKSGFSSQLMRSRCEHYLFSLFD
jgi:hypothetical protein